MSDCPVCMGIEGYNIHMCGKGSGGTTLNHSGTSAAELIKRIAELEAILRRVQASAARGYIAEKLREDIRTALL